MKRVRLYINIRIMLTAVYEILSNVKHHREVRKISVTSLNKGYPEIHYTSTDMSRWTLLYVSIPSSNGICHAVWACYIRMNELNIWVQVFFFSKRA
jgi:hypothetical protein